MRISQVKTGQEVEVIKPYNGLKIGDVIKVHSKSYSSVYYNNGNSSIPVSFLSNVSNTRVRISNKIKEKQEEIKELQAKLDFLKESGEATYNENTFKAYQTLKLIDNKKLSNMERAKLISKLIN